MAARSAQMAPRRLASPALRSLMTRRTAELSAIPGARVDYARIVDAETLQPLARLDRPAVAAVAAFLGTTRLIDNLVISD